MYSKEHLDYLKKKKKELFLIITFQILLIVLFLAIWEILVKYKVLNSFLSSSPSLVIKTIYTLFKSNNLLKHIFTTLYETLISFSIGTILGLLIATILWWNKKIAKIFDPYLTILSSLPKVSFGPLLIIWIGANQKTIIIIALLIAIFTTIINMYHAFTTTDNYKITLLKSFKATKLQIFTNVVFPSNIKSLINTLKINISLTLIGVIMGELLISKQGLGYLINYGTQIFNLNLVITSIFILGIISYLLYFILEFIEKKITK